jgi:hypothetical protein
MPVIDRMSSPEKCMGVPMPELPKVIAPGFDFASAM